MTPASHTFRFRESRRLPREAPVLLTMPGGAEVEARTHDLATGGMFVCTEELQKVGIVIRFLLELGSEAAPDTVEGDATVVWVREEPGELDHPGQLDPRPGGLELSQAAQKTPNVVQYAHRPAHEAIEHEDAHAPKREDRQRDPKRNARRGVSDRLRRHPHAEHHLLAGAKGARGAEEIAATVKTANSRRGRPRSVERTANFGAGGCNLDGRRRSAQIGIGQQPLTGIEDAHAVADCQRQRRRDVVERHVLHCAHPLACEHRRRRL